MPVKWLKMYLKSKYFESFTQHYNRYILVISNSGIFQVFTINIFFITYDVKKMV